MSRIEPILGLLIGIGGVLIGNILEGGTLGSLLQLTAALIVFGGTFGATLLSHRMVDIRMAFDYFGRIFSGGEEAERERIAKEIVESAQLARRETLLSLESKINKYSDPFMRSVFRFAIDGVEPEILRKIFSEEIVLNERRKMAAAKVWADAGGFAPTIGIIGAVLGLIQVMANITDTSALGHGIAVAFVATIYGVGSANLVFIPISNKLKSLIKYRSETEQMVLDGAVSIISGLNPYLIEQKMRAFSVELSRPGLA